MIMECIRCHAEDTDSARFCRQCGYPFAFDELMTCPVCAGEVRSGSKVCPGCQHVFAMPVAIKHEIALPVRTRRYAVPAIALFLLTGFGFFYAIADLGVVRERSTYVKLQEAPLPAPPPLEIAVPPPLISPVVEVAETPVVEVAETPVVEVAETPIVEPEAAVIEEQPREVKKVIRHRSTKEAPRRAPQDNKSRGGKKAVTDSREAPKPAPAQERDAEALRAEAQSEPVPPVLNQSVVEKSKSPESADARDARDSKALVGKAAVAAADRIKAGARSVPVVERSRTAAASQKARLAQEVKSDCEGKWEGACRQFPDHKPKW